MDIVKVASKTAVVNPRLDEKLLSLACHGHTVRYSDSGFGIAEVRNRVVMRFLKDSSAAHLLMIDSDMVWLDETDEILTKLGLPVAYAQYVSKTGLLAHKGGLGAACLRISRPAAGKISPPWFQFGYDKDGCADVSCECSFFAKKAVEAGIETLPLGVIGHIIPFIAIPNGNASRLRPLEI